MIEKVTLDTGVRVLLDPVPYMRSVTMGIWVGAGSRLEGSGQRGIFHFIEHMLFKGTRRRSSQQIALEIDGIGGILNGFTSRECSSFYAKVMDAHLPVAVDLLTDLYIHSIFDPNELERERNVILQEIKMVDETPEEHIMDLFHKAFWKGSAMGHPIQGDRRSVSKLQRESMLDHLGRYYHHAGSLVSVSGRFEKAALLPILGEKLRHLSSPPRWPKRRRPRSHPGLFIVDRDLEQVHVVLGGAAPSIAHPDRHAYYLLNTIFGGGMSSRLFQEIREKRGLAYSVYSFMSPYADTGMWAVYLATSRSWLKGALEVVLGQMEDLDSSPPDGQSLRAAKEQIKGNLILGLESSDRRMARQAKNELYFGREVPVEEVIEQMERVGPEDVCKAAQKTFRVEELTGVILGPASVKDIPSELASLLL